MTDTSTAVGASAPPVQHTLPTPQKSASGGALTFSQVKNYWIQAGGNPQAADMAAAVADAESGLNPNAQRTNPDGTVGVGLWLLPQNGTPPGSTDPLASARAALQLSNNGTDWTQWCSTWSDNNCGQDNGTYLGSGANALMSLQTQSSPGSYSVFGSAPAGTGQGASGAVGQSSGTTGTTSSNSKVLTMIVVVVVVAAVVFFSRKKMGGGQPAGPGPDAPQLETGGGPATGKRTVRIPAYTRTVG